MNSTIWVKVVLEIITDESDLPAVATNFWLSRILNFCIVGKLTIYCVTISHVLAGVLDCRPKTL